MATIFWITVPQHSEYFYKLTYDFRRLCFSHVITNKLRKGIVNCLSSQTFFSPLYMQLFKICNDRSHVKH